MTENNSSDEPTVEERLARLEGEIFHLRRENAIQASMIGEYRQALSDSQFKVAALNGQLKIALEPTEESLGSPMPRES